MKTFIRVKMKNSDCFEMNIDIKNIYAVTETIEDGLEEFIKLNGVNLRIDEISSYVFKIDIKGIEYTIVNFEDNKLELYDFGKDTNIFINIDNQS